MFTKVKAIDLDTRFFAKEDRDGLSDIYAATFSGYKMGDADKPVWKTINLTTSEWGKIEGHELVVPMYPVISGPGVIDDDKEERPGAWRVIFSTEPRV